MSPRILFVLRKSLIVLQAVIYLIYLFKPNFFQQSTFRQNVWQSHSSQVFNYINCICNCYCLVLKQNPFYFNQCIRFSSEV